MSQTPLRPLSATLPQLNPPPTKELPDLAAALPWRTWEDGLAEAQQRHVPILALAEPVWANSTQRFLYILDKDEKLRTLMSERVIPVLVDPFEHSDLVATWRWTSIALTGTSGPPLMVFLTHEGLPFLSYCTMTPEGDETYPSLASLIESTASAYAENAEGFLTEARSWATSSTAQDASDLGAARDRWEALRPEMNLKQGGFNEVPKHPHPQLLWAWLEDHRRGTLPEDLIAWGRKALDQMPRGAMYDQIDRGFHRCARDERWIAPHFEKIVPLNAQLAAVYARAAAQFEQREYRDLANQLQMFCAIALRDNIDLIASDSDYYTWTSPEVVRQLDPEVVQVVALHFDIQPAAARLALRRAVEMEEMDRYTYEDVETLKARLVKGKAQMLMVRQRRPAPPMISVPALGWRAETIRWLFVASEWLKSIDLPSLETALDRLTAGGFHEGQGYLRPNTSTAWLEDQAAILAAFVAAHQANGAQRWRDRAKELADTLLAAYATDTGWVDRPGATVPSRNVTDDIVPAAVSTATIALTELGRTLNDPSYGERAAKSTAAHRPMFAAGSYWSASSWTALEPERA